MGNGARNVRICSCDGVWCTEWNGTTFDRISNINGMRSIFHSPGQHLTDFSGSRDSDLGDCSKTGVQLGETFTFHRAFVIREHLNWQPTPIQESC